MARNNEVSKSLFFFWLGRSGFELTPVGHPDIDLFAYHKETKRKFGISIRPQVRQEGEKGETVNLDVGDIPRFKEACNGFDAEPYLGITVFKPIDNLAGCYLLSLDALLKRNPPKKQAVQIGLNESYWVQYESNKCHSIRFTITDAGIIYRTSKSRDRFPLEGFRIPNMSI